MGSSESQSPVQTIRSKGVPIEVEVYTTHLPSKRFGHRWRLKGKYDWNEGNILVPKDDDHDLHFEIVDDAGIGARFKMEPDEAFGAATGGRCPDAGEDADEIDFKNSNVAEQGRKLFIRDCNHLKGELTYSLFFDSPNGPLVYDPIIENGGGGPPMSFAGDNR